MSALGTLAGAAVSGIWKMATFALLAILLVVGAGGGMGWWLTDRARDQALVDLGAEKLASEQLRGSIREQNRAVETMDAAKKLAEARGLAAQQVAAANGRRLDGALAQLAGARATTCDEAMPAVNQLLGDIR